MRTIDQTMPEGLEEYTWECEHFAFPIICWIEVDPGEPASWDCPGSETTASVIDAFCGGMSIRGILAPWLLNALADDFLQYRALP